MTNAIQRVLDALKKHPPSVRQASSDGNDVTLQVNYGDAALAALEASGAVDLADALERVLNRTELAYSDNEEEIISARAALARYRGEI